ncbi:MAG: hypothetical protein JKY86_13480 [Gammaproteobacteria bacterium]|nr:hypothetical protein [Gammaproteobacteria bacterium]
MAFLLLMFIASSGVASEGASYNIEKNTLTIPVVSVDDLAFYNLELGLPHIETEYFFDANKAVSSWILNARSQSMHVRTDIFFDVKAVSEIETKSNSDAYYSINASRLNVPNVDVAGEQWIMNLGLASDGSRFIFDSALLPSMDADGRILEVEYIDSSLNGFTYRFDERGSIKSIAYGSILYTFLSNQRVLITGNIKVHNSTWLGEVDIADLDSPIALNNFFNSFWHSYNAEGTSDTADPVTVGTAVMTHTHPSFIALSIRSWIFTCASAAVSTDSWESIAQACDSPAN